jgi:P27 family predicted phage terminase small subunit
LSKIDRAALAAYCQSYGRWVQAEQRLAEMAERDPITAGLMIKTSNGNVVQNPLVGAANRALHEMVRIATEFGMTPSSRMNMPAKVEQAEGKWHGLLAS